MKRRGRALCPPRISPGVDSFVEGVSGGVLIWRLRSEATGDLDEEAVERLEHRARR
jgi:hypothetical protein